MSNTDQKAKSLAPTPLEREQALCAEALASGEFDDMSDSEWVAMCEEAAREQSASRQESEVAQGN